MDNIAGIDAFSRRMKRGGFFGPELRTRHSRISALDRLGEYIFSINENGIFWGFYVSDADWEGAELRTLQLLQYEAVVLGIR